MRWSGLLNETLCLCPTPLEEMCSWIKRLCFWQNSLQAHTSEAEHKNIVSRMKVRFESAVVGARRKGSFTSQPTPTNTNLCKSSTCDHSPTTVHITSLHWRCSRVVCIFVCLRMVFEALCVLYAHYACGFRWEHVPHQCSDALAATDFNVMLKAPPLLVDLLKLICDHSSMRQTKAITRNFCSQRMNIYAQNCFKPQYLPSKFFFCLEPLFILTHGTSLLPIADKWWRVFNWRFYTTGATVLWTKALDQSFVMRQ